MRMMAVPSSEDAGTLLHMDISNPGLCLQQTR